MNNPGYGAAIRKALKKGENIRDAKLIADAFKIAEEQPSGTPHQTFGDMINAGKLPE